MRHILLKCLLVMATLNSCAQPFPKFSPEYKGVDDRAKPLVDEYVRLSNENHLQFYNKVTVGFKDIGQGDVVGLCTYGIYFREIDIDTKFWNESNSLTHLALLFHELTHCYCGRDHDYSKGNKYPPTPEERLAVALKWRITGGDRPGYWEDGCPTTFMFPVVVDNVCVTSHYQEYVKEMFDRCRAF